MTDATARVAAAIDIGSNSIKMSLGRLDGDGKLIEFGQVVDVVRLGQGVERTGELDPERVEAAVATLVRFASEARAGGVSEIDAVATEAARAARNGEAFLERVRREAGINVRVIDGVEEATLTFRGLATDTDLSGHVVVADIGGGSTEFIVANDGVVLGARSTPLGSGRLTERFVTSDPPTPEALAQAQAEADAVTERLARSLKLPRGEGVRLIVVGGTGEYLARMTAQERSLDRRAVQNVLGKMAVLNAAELAEIIEAPEARARVLPAGVAIVAAIASRVLATRIETARSGIRSGLLLEALTWPSPATKPRKPRAARPRKEPRPTPAATAEGVSLRAAMRGLIHERWQDVWRAMPAAIEGADSEGVHDVRVASRRLRAAMDVAAPAFPKRWYRPLHRAAKEITSALGEVRDRDVILERLQAQRAASSPADWPGIDRLIDRLDAERLVARAAMETYLADLLAGPLPAEVARRFGPAASAATEAEVKA
ncbi:MAG: CHAD domain-containing protein [Thermomicrobiales bacterium]|nr:CHAD domain-containing protein [Thermomicrobiales bacterium]